MKNYFYPRTFCRLFIFFLVSILFSCSKDLENPLKTPTNDLEKAPPPNYNYATNPIDTDVLLSLKQDTLFNEFVWLLDYSYITHLTDSLRKATNNREMFYNCYLEIMKKRTGTILERFNMVKNQYPEDFFKYVIHQSSAKKNLSRTIDQSLDTMHIDDVHVHTDQFYFEQAAYYNDIINSIHTLASRAKKIFHSEIIQCNNSTCRSYERLIWSTFQTVINSEIYPDMHLIYAAQYLSRNLTQTIIASDVRMAINTEYIECIPIKELREKSDYCIGVIISSIEWNGNFKAGFVGRMNCNMYDHWEPDDGGNPGGGGTTNPPDPDQCKHKTCSVCKKYIRTSTRASVCNSHMYCEKDGNCARIILSLSKTELDLGKEFDMIVSIQSSVQQRITYAEYRIKDESRDESFNCDNQAKICTAMARTPGNFKVYAEVTLDGHPQPMRSNEVSVVFRYPLRDFILQQSAVIEGINNSWEQTLSAADTSGIQEFGGVVMINTLETNTGNLYAYEEKSGIKVPYSSETANVLLDSEDKSYGITQGGKFRVLIFHTHPPFWNYKGSDFIYRKVGPSDPDTTQHTTIPAVVKDFWHHSKQIDGKMEASEYQNTAKLYYYGVNRREN